MISVFLDRIEGDVAVLIADAGTLKIPARLLPQGAREGTYLKLALEPDPEAQKAAEARAAAARRGRKKDDGGDFAL